MGFGQKMVISYFSSATRTENKSWAILGASLARYGLSSLQKFRARELVTSGLQGNPVRQRIPLGLVLLSYLRYDLSVNINCKAGDHRDILEALSHSARWIYGKIR
jgi:hypothetical protein